MSATWPRIRMPVLLAMLAMVFCVGIVTIHFWLREPHAARQARQALAAGRYNDADVALARWLKAVPAAAEAHLLKGRVAVELGHIAEAVAELNRAQNDQTDPHGMALLRAIIASKAGRHAVALPVLQQAFDAGRAPDRQVDQRLAKTYLETYDLEGAAVVLDRWARDFPDDPKPHLWRAEIDRRTGGDGEALQRDYREAIRRDPSLAAGRLPPAPG
jgi:tetratricopeptide (TPR) repeat protein